MSHLRDIACDLDVDPDYLTQAFEHYGVQLIEVGTVPPWMERVAERALMLPKDEPDSWWYGDDNSHIAPSAPNWQPLFAIREDKP